MYSRIESLSPRRVTTMLAVLLATAGMAVMAMATKPSNAQAASCPYYYLCLYDGTDFSGASWKEWRCGTYNLGHYGFHDKTSSLINNQTNGTVSYFYDYKGWGDPFVNKDPVIAQRAYGYRRNLAWDTAYDGRSADNRIDIVKVC